MIMTYSLIKESYRLYVFSHAVTSSVSEVFDDMIDVGKIMEMEETLDISGPRETRACSVGACLSLILHTVFN